jgi:hypothetical protein
VNLLKKYNPLEVTAISHTLLRVLCLLIIEYDCARLVEKSSGTPAVLGNYLLASVFGLGLVLMLFRVKWGYMIGMFAGAVNVAVKVVIGITGHEHYPYWPIVWITQSLMVAYFSFMAYKSVRGED